MRIIALHGFLGLPSDWRCFAGRFPSIDAVDLWQDILALPDGDAFSKWTSAFCARIRAARADTKPVLLGYSMGARLAMRAAIAAPELFSAAIFVSGGPGLTSEEQRATRLQTDETWARRFAGDTWSDVVADWNAQAIFKFPKSEDSISFDRRQQDFDRLALSLAMTRWSLGRQHDLRAELARLPLPVLYVAGELDTKFRDILETIPIGASHLREIIAGTGHRAPWDDPAAFSAIVARFVRRVIASR